MSEYKILGVKWFSNMFAHIGIVAIQTGLHDPEHFEWKAYMSVVRGDDPKADEQLVAALGSPLLPEEAHGFFPHLDIEQYKKD